MEQMWIDHVLQENAFKLRYQVSFQNSFESFTTPLFKNIEEE